MKRSPCTKESTEQSRTTAFNTRAIWTLALKTRFLCFAMFAVLLTTVFTRPLVSLMIYARHSELNSYILLVPFISGYLIYVQRRKIPTDYVLSVRLGIIFFGAGLAGLATAWGFSTSTAPVGRNDDLALMALSFVCLLVAGGFVFLGQGLISAVAFPVAFLIFLVPLPDAAVNWLETTLKLASAEAANLLFTVTGTPILRDGTVFQLPGITIEVAAECSGIRSTLVLFITSLLVSYLFLKNPWRRILLVACVLPLGILRNAFRILTIGLLCVHVSPDMVHSDLHKRGGSVFFALSLIPLFLLLWWLRKGDRRVIARQTNDLRCQKLKPEKL